MPLSTTLEQDVLAAMREVFPTLGTATTWSGRKLDFTSTHIEPPPLLDIARGLSRMPRFCGQTNKLYTVAEHSIEVSVIAFNLAEQDGADFHGCRMAAACGLMHDAAEAFICDIPMPLKDVLEAAGNYRLKTIEAALLVPILAHYAGEDHAAYKGCVKLADRIAFLREHRDLRDGQDYEFLPKSKLRVYESDILAESSFLQRASELGIPYTT